MIPATKTVKSTSSAVATTAPSTSTTAPARQTTPTPAGITRLQTHSYNTRQNSPGPTPLTPSTQNSMPLPQIPTSAKPMSKSSVGIIEPLQTSSNGKNDQNVDPSSFGAAGAGEMDLSGDNAKAGPTAPVKTIPSASAPLKRSAGTASGGVEKRKKGLKRL